MSFNLFNSIRIKKPQRNSFDLSHDVKLSMNMGDLIPIYCEPVIPGDTFKLNTEILMRFAPLISPVMHRINVYTHFFFVPNRLIWDEWEEFITGGDNPQRGKGTKVPPQYPTFGYYPSSGQMNSVQFINFRVGSLADYLGFPVFKDPDEFSAKVMTGSQPFNADTSNNFVVDALPFRAYQLIYNEYYRDQNLTDEIEINKDKSGPQPLSISQELFKLRKRAWEKDYFTSALPWPQAGPSIRLPMHGEIDIPAQELLVQSSTAAPVANGGNEANGNLYISGDNVPNAPYDNTKQIKVGSSNAVILGDAIYQGDTVNLENVTETTLNEFRRAVKAQEFLEVSARGGGRYIEQIRSFFGVKSSDARLQRPEYLGGGKSPVVISDVQQTSQTTDGDNGSPQGNLSGQAVSLQRSHSFKRFFEEHGYIIGIMSVLPRSAYQQGLPRKYTKFSRYDYYWPQFAHLGEQEILNRELYFDTSDNKNTLEFGYTPRYAEYKYSPSRVCGDFRDTLSFWHMGRIFKNRPNLNTNFVSFDGDNRIFADENDDYNKLWVNIHFNVSALRPMPVYGTPLL